jgi:PAS domain S-box-containing protein
MQNILIVEDDLISRMALKEQLEEKELGNILLAKNDKQTFEQLASHKVDLILMDVQLKNSLSGIDITKKIKTEYDNIPIIFITGNSDKSTFLKILETTPHAIINKPVDLPQLHNAILTAIAKKNAQKTASALSNDQILSLIYETAKIGMCVTDENGYFVRVNNAYCDNYGYTEEELIGNVFTMVLPEDYRDDAQQIHDDFIAKRIVEMPKDWKVKTRASQIKEVHVTAGHMINTDGRAYKITTVTDVSERNAQFRSLQKSLKEREILEKEIFHRVKNNLNMVVSLFQLQKARISENPEAVEIITSGISRVRSLALLHERLYKQEDVLTIDMVNYKDDLIRFLFENTPLALSINKEVIALECDVDTAVSLGLIINEILTNIIKHAFNNVLDDFDAQVNIILKNSKVV